MSLLLGVYRYITEGDEKPSLSALFLDTLAEVDPSRSSIHCHLALARHQQNMIFSHS